MAFGALKGTLTGNGPSIGASNSIAGSVVVAKGDLIFAVISEQTSLTATGATDNLGNTYTAQNAGTLSGTTVSGRAFWTIATVAGTLTSVAVAATSSTNDWAGFAAVIEGSFTPSGVSTGVDANPANNTTQTTSPFSAPATGTLVQSQEVIMCWASNNSSATWSATGPNLLAGQINNSTNAHAVIGYQAVTSTSTVTPQFTAGTNPTANVMGTISFKGMAMALGMGRGDLFNRTGMLKAAAMAPLSVSLALLASVQVQAPFAQLNWPHTRAIRATTAFTPPQSLALLFPKAATLRPPVLGKPQILRGLVDPPLGSPIALLTSVVQNPFSLLDWSPPGRVRLIPPPQAPYNQNLFTNPIPFGPYDYSEGPTSVRPPPPQAPPYNINIFTNPIPFGPYDYSKGPTRIGPPPPQHPTINLNLYKNPIPFGPYDYNIAHPLAPSKPFDQQPNYPNFYPNPIPFGPYDYNVAHPLGPSKPFEPQPNYANFYPNPIPFAQYDWSKPAPFQPKAADVYQPYQNFAVVVVTAPFVPYDFSKPWPVGTSPPQPVPYNLNLFTNPIPFTPYDFSKPATVTATPPQPIPYNLALTTSVVQNPIIPFDWSISVRLRASPPQPINRNPLIFSEVPFIPVSYVKPAQPIVATPHPPQLPLPLYANLGPFRQTDFGPTRRVTGTPLAPTAYNLNIYGAVPVPFVFIDWGRPFAVRTTPLPPVGTNINLFTNPIPFFNPPQPAPFPVKASLQSMLAGFQIKAPVVLGVPGLAYSVDQLVYSGLTVDVAPFLAKPSDASPFAAEALDSGTFLADALDKAAFGATASDSRSGQNWSGDGYMAQYEIDTSIELQGIFTNSLTGVYADPTSITLFILDPSGVQTSQVWPAGSIVRDSLGHFHFILTPSKSGIWTYKWQGTGAIVATSPDTTFTVNSSALIPG